MSNSDRMPAFASFPEEDKTGPSIEVFRIGDRPKRGLIAASHDPLGVYTHWRNSRKLPCLGDGCECHETGEERRWYGYVAIWQPSTCNMGILEYTRAAAMPIKEYFDKHRTLRGAAIDAHRRSEKRNARLVLSIYEGRFPKEEIPKAPNREQVLCRIWGINYEAFNDGTLVAKQQRDAEQILPLHATATRSRHE